MPSGVPGYIMYVFIQCILRFLSGINTVFCVGEMVVDRSGTLITLDISWIISCNYDK